MTDKHWISPMLLSIALVACFLPWFYQPVAALRPGVLDAAEWITLAPAARASAPPLLASLPLRLLLGLAAVALAWEMVNVRGAGQRAIFGVIMALALLMLFPALEVFTGAFSDPNYQQQALVFVITLLGCGLVAVMRRPAPRMQLAVALAAGLCGIWGMLEGLSFFQAYAVPAVPGVGAVVFHTALLLLLVLKMAQVVTSAAHNKKPE